MADVAITKAERDGSTITVTGSGITKTTTKFFLDGEEWAHESSSDTTATLQSEGNEMEVYAVKGEIETDPVTIVTKGEQSEQSEQSEQAEGPAKTATPNHTPGDVTEDDQTADASVADLNKAANQGAVAKTPQNPDAPEHGTAKSGQHVEASNFRESVDQTAAGDLNMDPLEPYPTGNPPDPREVYHRIHGKYPKDEEDDRGRP